jgi:hypothetical protein
MRMFAGLDVGFKRTAVCMLDEADMCGWPPPGKRKCSVPHRSRLQQQPHVWDVLIPLVGTTMAGDFNVNLLPSTRGI